MQRRTKIVATIGPASEDEATLRALVNAGMDVARLGLAHGSLDEAEERFLRIRRVAAEEGRVVGILVDLPGPKVRSASFGEEKVVFAQDDLLELRPGNTGSTTRVIEVDYESLLSDIQPGDRLNLGDGRLILDVTDKTDTALKARVAHGGTLQGRPGVHIPADRLRMSTPTDWDFKALDRFVDLGVDIIAVSFVKSAHDIRRVGTEPYPRGPIICAKIETRTSIENIDGIIEAAGSVMVARGDLGNECTLEDLPYLQKEIIRKCIAFGRPVITATQMLESMITSPAPTRAEASDVANAVWDGSSALMLSGETAVGHDPVNAVRTMARIARRADEEFDRQGWHGKLADLHHVPGDQSDRAVTDAMTTAASRAIADLGIETVICISGSGFTVRSMSRFRPHAQILGMSHDPRTVQQLAMSWGTIPMHMPDDAHDETERVARAMELARDSGHVRSGELVAVLAGVSTRARSTNTMRLERVP
jgi:pyruvate kinase